MTSSPSFIRRPPSSKPSVSSIALFPSRQVSINSEPPTFPNRLLPSHPLHLPLRDESRSISNLPRFRRSRCSQRSVEQVVSSSFSPADARCPLFLLAAASMVSTIGFGALSDNPRLTLPLLLLSCFGSAASVLLVWGFAAETVPGLIGFAVFYGAMSGGFSALWAAMSREVGGSFLSHRLVLPRATKAHAFSSFSFPQSHHQLREPQCMGSSLSVED